MQRLTWLLLQLILFCLLFSACVPVKAMPPSNLPTSTPISQVATPFITVTPFAPTATRTPTPTIALTPTIVIPNSVKNSEHWAIISSERASFWFWVDPNVVEWRWFSAEFDDIEYEWGVEFPFQNEVYSTTYSAEVLLFYDRKIHSSPQQGDIHDLLNTCDFGLWIMERGGMSNAQAQFPNAVSASYFNGGILIELTNPIFIANLYERRPESLLFKTFSYNDVLPDQEVNVSVIYQ